MSTEKFANDVRTSLNGSINNSTTTVVVNSASGFPSAGQYRIRIDDELMLVTSGAGTTTWTVTRGVEGTSGASHTTAANVDHVLTAGALDQKLIDDVSTAAIASRQAAEKAGRLFLPSDGPQLWRDDGSNWAPFGPIFPMTAVPANQTGYAWVNQGTTTNTIVSGTWTLTIPKSASDTVAALVKTAPAAPYTLIACVALVPYPGQQYPFAGICLRQSSDGKLICYGVLCNESGSNPSCRRIQARKYTNATSFSADLQAIDNNWIPNFCWLKLVDDNTNRILSYGVDGVNWIQLVSEGRTVFLTADQIGVFTNPLQGNTGDSLATFYSLSGGF